MCSAAFLRIGRAWWWWRFGRSFSFPRLHWYTVLAEEDCEEGFNDSRDFLGGFFVSFPQMQSRSSFDLDEGQLHDRDRTGKSGRTPPRSRSSRLILMGEGEGADCAYIYPYVT
jgi:hypothetical protein